MSDESDIRVIADFIARDLDDTPLYEPDPRFPTLHPHSQDYIEEMEQTAKALLESDWLAEHDRQVAEAARRDTLEEAATALMNRPYVRGGFDFTEDAASFIRALIEGEKP